MKKRFLECGKIVATHGLRGEVKVLPWCDGPEALVPIKTFYLDGGNTPKRAERCRIQKNMVLLGKVLEMGLLTLVRSRRM